MSGSESPSDARRLARGRIAFLVGLGRALDVTDPNLAQIARDGQTFVDALERSYPATPVDCLLSELRDYFGMDGRDALLIEDFEDRVAQFKAEVEAERG